MGAENTIRNDVAGQATHLGRTAVLTTVVDSMWLGLLSVLFRQVRHLKCCQPRVDLQREVWLVCCDFGLVRGGMTCMVGGGDGRRD